MDRHTSGGAVLLVTMLEMVKPKLHISYHLCVGNITSQAITQVTLFFVSYRSKFLSIALP
ncbi:MAG: hypothetical protein LBH46_01290 [Rickettsiales bacterium]|nr:hypothetical protein [Rickettsiales bacterium]